MKAIQLLIEKSYYIDWDLLSLNSSVIELLKNNQNLINWYNLSSNENDIDLLNENQDKIVWYVLSENLGIFELDFFLEIMKPSKIFNNMYEFY